LKELNPDL